MSFKRIQIKLDDSVPVESKVIEHLSAFGKGSGQPKRLLMAGFDRKDEKQPNYTASSVKAQNRSIQVQIRLRFDVPRERAVIEYIDSFGKRSGIPKLLLISGFHLDVNDSEVGLVDISHVEAKEEPNVTQEIVSMLEAKDEPEQQPDTNAMLLSFGGLAS